MRAASLTSVVTSCYINRHTIEVEAGEDGSGGGGQADADADGGDPHGQEVVDK